MFLENQTLTHNLRVTLANVHRLGLWTLPTHTKMQNDTKIIFASMNFESSLLQM